MCIRDSLGGTDGWLMFGNNTKLDNNGNFLRERYFNSGNQPDPDQEYAFQSLAVPMRGYIQNVANGNNAVVLNSEFRLPVVSTFFDRSVNNPFLRNFMIVQFFDFGTAWNGKYDSFKRPQAVSCTHLDGYKRQSTTCSTMTRSRANCLKPSARWPIS